MNAAQKELAAAVAHREAVQEWAKRVQRAREDVDSAARCVCQLMLAGNTDQAVTALALYSERVAVHDAVWADEPRGE